MKKNPKTKIHPATITIKNEVPEILEALCQHPECPEWLRNDIWDSFNEWAERHESYSAAEWREFMIREPRLDDPRDRGTCWTPKCKKDIVWSKWCAECLQQKATEAAERAARWKARQQQGVAA